MDITPQQERVLRQMYRDNEPVADICRVLQVGERQLKAWRRELDIPDRPTIKRNKNASWETGSYWSLQRHDKAFAEIMAGRTFEDDPRARRPEKRRIVSRAYPAEPGRWESTAAWS